MQLTHLSTKTYEPPKLRLNRTSEEYEEESETENTDDDGDGSIMNQEQTETWSYNANWARVDQGFVSNIFCCQIQIVVVSVEFESFKRIGTKCFCVINLLFY